MSTALPTALSRSTLLTAILGLASPALAFAQAGIVTDGEPIARNDSVEGTLEEGDLKHEEDNSLFDPYVLEVTEGETSVITLASEEFDALLFLFDERGEILDLNDDYDAESQSLNARIEWVATESGRVIIYANTVYSDGMGAYTLTVE